jgi:hypothetical protein
MFRLTAVVAGQRGVKHVSMDALDSPTVLRTVVCLLLHGSQH